MKNTKEDLSLAKDLITLNFLEKFINDYSELVITIKEYPEINRHQVDLVLTCEYFDKLQEYLNKISNYLNIVNQFNIFL